MENNDKVRVRNVCTFKDCSRVALCSWDNICCTYLIKKVDLEHRCCGVFRNKVASREWFANKLEQRLMI